MSTRRMGLVLVVGVGFILACSGAGTAGGPGGVVSPEPAPSVAPSTAPEAIATLTTLGDGRVLAYGLVRGQAHGTASILDATSLAWTATSPPPFVTAPRAHTLPDGRVLVIGAEATLVFDPSTNAWTSHAALSGRASSLPIVSAQSRALVLGSGECEDSSAPPGGASFDATTGTWTPLPPSGVARDVPSALLLADGRVWVAGGVDACIESYWPPTSSSEFLDSSGSGWARGPTLLAQRTRHGAVPLPDGRVLLFGGIGADPTAEAVDLVAGRSTPVAYVGPNIDFGLVQRSDGTWWVIGGRRDPSVEEPSEEALAEVWILDPVTASFRAGPPLGAPTDNVTATSLPDGRLVIAGTFGSDKTWEILPAP